MKRIRDLLTKIRDLSNSLNEIHELVLTQLDHLIETIPEIPMPYGAAQEAHQKFYGVEPEKCMVCNNTATVRIMWVDIGGMPGTAFFCDDHAAERKASAVMIVNETPLAIDVDRRLRIMREALEEIFKMNDRSASIAEKALKEIKNLR